MSGKFRPTLDELARNGWSTCIAGQSPAKEERRFLRPTEAFVRRKVAVFKSASREEEPISIEPFMLRRAK